MALLGVLLVAPTASAQESCPDGRVSTEDTFGNCCWPGQGWTGKACVGQPRSCPVGWTRTADACELPECPTGKERSLDGVNCCWPEQAWLPSTGACIGTPVCPEHYVPKGDDCVQDPDWLARQRQESESLQQAEGAVKSRREREREEKKKLAAARSKIDPLLAAVGEVSINAGTFNMGCRGDGCDSEQRPARVELTQDLHAMASEVTQALYSELMRSNPTASASQHLGGVDFGSCASFRGAELVHGDRPVVCVTWADAARMANRLSGVYELEPAYSIRGEAVDWNPQADGWRLPTEAEWEYMARAGRSGLYAGANDQETACGAANIYSDGDREGLGANREAFDCRDRDLTLATIGAYQPNGFGLHDMTGNAAEWTWDAYEIGQRRGGEAMDPAGPSGGTLRAIRGGSWLSGPDTAAVANRYGVSPARRSVDLGFRLVRNDGPSTLIGTSGGQAAPAGRLALSADEDELQVLIDGQLQYLPALSVPLAEGAHRITIWDPRFQTENLDVQVVAGEAAALKLEPTGRRGELRVAAEKSGGGDWGAEVRIDGQMVGETPHTALLPSGRYTVRLGWEDPVEVEVVDYEPRALALDLGAPPQARPDGTLVALAGAGVLAAGVPTALIPHQRMQASLNGELSEPLTEAEYSRLGAIRIGGAIVAGGGLVTGLVGVSKLNKDRALNDIASVASERSYRVAASPNGVTLQGRF